MARVEYSHTTFEHHELLGITMTHHFEQTAEVEQIDVELTVGADA
mgnify:CR=1 FL=1